MKLRIGIVDYSIGNWGSIKNALYKIGFNPIVSQNSHQLRESDLLILPGVGAFPPAIKAIKERGLDKFLCEMAVINKPIIGICLGMQLLGRSSSENQFIKGLNLIPEDVIPLGSNLCHIGWNSIKVVKQNSFINKYNDFDFYFNHSYGFSSNLNYSICETQYKQKRITSVIQKGKIVGLQFHPEKSQIQGMKFLQGLIYDLCIND